MKNKRNVLLGQIMDEFCGSSIAVVVVVVLGTIVTSSLASSVDCVSSATSTISLLVD